MELLGGGEVLGIIPESIAWRKYVVDMTPAQSIAVH